MACHGGKRACHAASQQRPRHTGTVVLTWTAEMTVDDIVNDL